MPEQASQTAKRSVLIAEDNDAIRSAYRQGLEEAGYEVFATHDGKGTLELANENRPDAILLDVLLPDMNGLEVLQKLREMESTKDVPVIIISNVDADEVINEATALGSNHYMLKANSSLADIVGKVEETLGTKQ